MIFLNIKSDSRKIKKGDTFVALKTLQHDGHDYVDDAIKRGATKVVVDHGLYDVETIVVEDTKEYLIQMLKEEYYDQIKDLNLIGMTGTNGKTTTCFCIHEALNNHGMKCGYIGTLGFYIKDKICDLPNTTPEITDMYEMLLTCRDKNCKVVVMEVSSHALSMKRVSGLEFNYVIFSNLTEDHLDYHASMEEYALAKQKLFYMLKENGKAIINYDDPYKNYFLLEQNHNITYGFQGGDYQVTHFALGGTRTEFTLSHGMDIPYTTSLLGKHNIYNLVCVLIVLEKLGINQEDRVELCEKMKAPAGRMDTILYDTNTIIVDYAHTPDAVEKILEAIHEFSKGNIITIIGCGGDRDRKKRPIMAHIATALSTYVIFTNDNPRTEDPKQIFQDMVQNLDNSNYEIVENREEAIIKGIQMLKKNDILIILGKGHENYQVIGTEKIDFDDKDIVVKTIRS